MVNKSSTQLLNYQQLGQGEHLVLIHGLFGSLENLNMVAKPLAQHFCVTSIDVRNHGQSFHDQGMSYPALAEDIINLLDSLSITTCHMLGHSMGGKIAMQLALLYPTRIKKLIVADIAPVAYSARHLKIIEGLQSIDLTTVNKRSDADKQLANYVSESAVRQFLLRNLTSNAQGEFYFKCNLNLIVQGYKDVLLNIENKHDKKFEGETLFIKGSNSDYILPQHQSAIAGLFSQAKAKIIQGAGHWLHAEKTVAFNKIVMDFLAK